MPKFTPAIIVALCLSGSGAFAESERYVTYAGVMTLARETTTRLQRGNPTVLKDRVTQPDYSQKLRFHMGKVFAGSAETEDGYFECFNGRENIKPVTGLGQNAEQRCSYSVIGGSYIVENIVLMWIERDADHNRHWSESRYQGHIVLSDDKCETKGGSYSHEARIVSLKRSHVYMVAKMTGTLRPGPCRVDDHHRR